MIVRGTGPVPEDDLFVQDNGESTHNVRVLADQTAARLAEGKTSLRAVELIEELTHWWLGVAADEAERTVGKAVEYGAHDLIEIGRNLALTQGRTVTDDEAAELGVYFYACGKLARWTSAIADGRRVSDDTLLDLGIYVRMAQRIRHAGSWPGAGH